MGFRQTPPKAPNLRIWGFTISGLQGVEGAIVAVSVHLDGSVLKSAKPRDEMVHQLSLSASLFGFKIPPQVIRRFLEGPPWWVSVSVDLLYCRPNGIGEVGRVSTQFACQE